jgi:5-deoxy-D-glucuronate isomerase
VWEEGEDRAWGCALRATTPARPFALVAGSRDFQVVVAALCSAPAASKRRLREIARHRPVLDAAGYASEARLSKSLYRHTTWSAESFLNISEKILKTEKK